NAPSNRVLREARQLGGRGYVDGRLIRARPALRGSCHCPPPRPNRLVNGSRLTTGSRPSAGKRTTSPQSPRLEARGGVGLQSRSPRFEPFVPRRAPIPWSGVRRGESGARPNGRGDGS